MPELLTGLLDANAARDPDGDAATDGTDRVSWTAYRDRAAALGGALLAAGVERGDRVAVHLPKSVDSFVAAHAVVRIGAVMVPVDWFAPPDYVGAVIGDAHVAAVISSAGVQRVHEIAGAAELAVLAPDAAGTPASPAEVDPADPAYIVYTSGSTGTPKGIVHTHASALAYAHRAVDTYDLGPSDRLANIAPLHFDQSTFELWAAPLAGAAVVIVPDGVLRFPASVSELIGREHATVWYSVPYAIEQLVTRGAPGDRDLSSLRWVLFGGESFPPAALAAAQQALPHARFSNVYGPAEVNQCTFHHVDTATPVGTEAVVPIGRAWADTELLLVDDADRVLDGVAEGELLVSSDTMMAGYWGRPELTAAAIVTRPATGDRRWYRTGDLVRREANGTYVFVGRSDHQVKVRGHRIELEAVESVINELAGVVACAVLVERGEEDRLVALVTPPPPATDRSAITKALRHRLPRYSLPAEIIGVVSVPRTGVGKIDRVAAAALLAENRAAPAIASPELLR